MWWLLLNIAVVAADLPTLNYTQAWAPVNTTNVGVRSFNITFGDDMVTDLVNRITNVRRPPSSHYATFDYGTNIDCLFTWLKYWAEEYDFQARQQDLNQFPHYKIRIQELDIHYMRIEPENKTKRRVYLLLLHGWPGSIREFYDVIPLLTADSDDRDFALELIVPSLPGFGFSDAPSYPGMGGVEIAIVIANMMEALGCDTYLAQGGDWGSYIAAVLATLFPEKVRGFHSNMAWAATQEAFLMLLAGTYLPNLVVEPAMADRVYPLYNYTSWLMGEMAYFYFQATKPDTLGVGLTDSPAALLAFFLQCFSSGTRRTNIEKADGGLLDFFTMDQILDNTMMYWTENKITTASRLYYETINSEYASEVMAYPTEVPFWALQAPNEMIYMSEKMLRTKYTNFLNATTLDEGGHFLALERPAVYAEDVIQAMTAFVKWNDDNGYTV